MTGSNNLRFLVILKHNNDHKFQKENILVDEPSVLDFTLKLR